jgi:hypothetical protein
VVLVHEFDEAHGGAALGQLRAECGDDEIYAFTFGKGRYPIPWHRIHELQLVSLKLIAGHLVKASAKLVAQGKVQLHSKETEEKEEEKEEEEEERRASRMTRGSSATEVKQPGLAIADDLYISGEIASKHLTFSEPVVLWASPRNPGARKVACELRDALVPKHSPRALGTSRPQVASQAAPQAAAQAAAEAPTPPPSPPAASREVVATPKSKAAGGAAKIKLQVSSVQMLGDDGDDDALGGAISGAESSRTVGPAVTAAAHRVHEVAVEPSKGPPALHSGPSAGLNDEVEPAKAADIDGIYFDEKTECARESVSGSKIRIRATTGSRTTSVLTAYRSQKSPLSVTSGDELPPMATHMLLYLNENTWVGEAGEALAEQVRAARDLDFPIVMIHERRIDYNACEFGHFFQTTPHELIVDGIYKALAVAWHSYPFNLTCAMQVATVIQGLPAHGTHSANEPTRIRARSLSDRLRSLHVSRV